MSATSDLNIATGIAAFLGPHERIVATLIASVRGHQQGASGGAGGLVGASRAGRARREAELAGITLSSPMVLVLTGRRLITAELGNRGKVKRLLDAFDLGEVGTMEVRRLGLGGAVTLELRGAAVRLESRVGASRAFAEALASTRSAPA